MRTASGPRCIGLPSLLLALALIVGLPAHGGAQHSSRAAVGAPHVFPHPPVGPITRLPVFPDIAPADSARRSPIPFLVGGALAGAAVGWLLAEAARGSLCDDPLPGSTCSTSPSPAVSALVGAGLGAVVGMFVWLKTRPAESRPRARSP
jgi:hypothetical protein